MKPTLICFCFLLISCARSPGDKNNGTVDLSSNQDLAAISAQVCSNGQILSVADSNDFLMRDLIPAIAIVSGDEDCANVDSVDDRWYDFIGGQVYFKFEKNLSCIPNNSIWKIKTRTVNSVDIEYRYTNLAGDQFIDMSGTYDLGATYARDHAGIRALICH